VRASGEEVERARGAMMMERDDGRRRAAGGERCVRSAARQEEQIMAGERVSEFTLCARVKITGPIGRAIGVVMAAAARMRW